MLVERLGSIHVIHASQHGIPALDLFDVHKKILAGLNTYEDF
ncbi:hypothetical protein ACCQ08_04460 [Comamonas sp. SY3]